MLHYIIQILAFQLLFLIVYDVFLKKETFFNWNRVYLLATPILSFILPFIKIHAIQENIPEEYIIQLPELLISGSTTKEILLPEIVLGSPQSFFTFLTAPVVWQYSWYLGVVISALLFVYKIFTIIKLKRTGTKTRVHNFNLVSLPNTNTAFSFFNTIFLGATLSETKKTNILLHEKVHVKEYHSLDLIFFELLRITMWFNPLVYVYQKRVAMLQEYIADAKAISEVNKKEYYQDLLSQIFQTDKISFINTFFNHSLIKNRIVMLRKSKSKKIFQLKYLLLVPVVSIMLVYTSCTQEIEAQNGPSSKDLAEGKSPLMQKIEAVKHQIEIQGNVTPEEEKALKVLALLVNNDGSNKTELPFAKIEKVPVYPGCENQSSEETKKCFMNNIQQAVLKEFNITVADKHNLSGKQKIYVRFKIDNTGKIGSVQARGPHQALEEEAIRVVKSLPKMTPGQQDGVNVGVLFSLPIVFEIKE